MQTKSTLQAARVTRLSHQADATSLQVPLDLEGVCCGGRASSTLQLEQCTELTVGASHSLHRSCSLIRQRTIPTTTISLQLDPRFKMVRARFSVSLRRHLDAVRLPLTCLLCLAVVRYVNERKRVGENQQIIIDIQHSIEGCGVRCWWFEVCVPLVSCHYSSYHMVLAVCSAFLRHRGDSSSKASCSPTRTSSATDARSFSSTTWSFSPSPRAPAYSSPRPKAPSSKSTSTSLECQWSTFASSMSLMPEVRLKPENACTCVQALNVRVREQRSRTASSWHARIRKRSSPFFAIRPIWSVSGFATLRPSSRNTKRPNTLRTRIECCEVRVALGRLSFLHSQAHLGISYNRGRSSWSATTGLPISGTIECRADTRYQPHTHTHTHTLSFLSHM